MWIKSPQERYERVRFQRRNQNGLPKQLLINLFTKSFISWRRKQTVAKKWTWIRRETILKATKVFNSHETNNAEQIYHAFIYSGVHVMELDFTNTFRLTKWNWYQTIYSDSVRSDTASDITIATTMQPPHHLGTSWNIVNISRLQIHQRS